MHFEYSVEALSGVLAYVFGNDARSVAERLLEKYGTTDRIMSADVNILAENDGLGKNKALFIKLVCSVISRSKTEKYKFGVTHSPSETDEYFKALLLPRSVECAYAMSFDKRKRAIACDLISEGVVNASELLPRKIVEIAKRRRAEYMILAHNHPHGRAAASDDDISATMSVARILANSNVVLVRHVIVSDNDVSSVQIGSDL